MIEPTPLTTAQQLQVMKRLAIRQAEALGRIRQIIEDPTFRKAKELRSALRVELAMAELTWA